jgi:hypothetical protein
MQIILNLLFSTALILIGLSQLLHEKRWQMQVESNDLTMRILEKMAFHKKSKTQLPTPRTKSGKAGKTSSKLKA